MLTRIRNLFLSRHARREQERLRFRHAQNTLRRRVETLKRAADRYWALAQRAHSLRAAEEFTQFGEQYMRLLHAINRWSRFLLKLESIELRRDEVVCTTEFMEGIQSVNRVIMDGAGPAEVARIRLELDQALDRSRETEMELDEFMEATGVALQEGTFTDAFPEFERLMSDSGNVPKLAESAAPKVADNAIELPFNEAMQRLRATSGRAATLGDS